MSLRLPTPGALAALAALLLSTAAAPARARLPCLPGPAAFAVSDTLGFRPAGTPPASARPADADSFNYSPAIQFFDSTGHEPLVVSPPVKLKYQTESEWLRAPMGDNLLDHPDAWESDHPRRAQVHGGLTETGEVRQSIVPIKRCHSNDIVQLKAGGIFRNDIVIAGGVPGRGDKQDTFGARAVYG